MNNAAVVTLAHGAGGRASSQLLEDVFLPAFGRQTPHGLPDAATFSLPRQWHHAGRLAMTTDSFVVSPITFPGGDIGKLAVCGTVNDLAVCGAQPLYLSAGFILEEGLPMGELITLVNSMAVAARDAQVKIITGDTKVVPAGQADKVYINTTGLGVVPNGVSIQPDQAREGDAVLVNGWIGDHGAAVMLAREELGFAGELVSDCAPLNGLIHEVLTACPNIHVMRDATRGGVGAVLAEIAQASGVTIALEETQLPIRPTTCALCELLGMDPLFFANEGLAVFVLPQAEADTALATMRDHPQGHHACQIGQVVNSAQNLLYINTTLGSQRILEVPYGIQLPRIC